MQQTLEPFGSLPPQAARRLEEIGPIWATDINGHRELVVQAYTPLVAAAPNQDIQVTREVHYGPHPRQVLDLYAPPGKAAGRGGDVLVFVHGGAFVRGKKSSNGHIYDNVPYWFARQGCLAVNLEYRLADEAPYPGGAADVALAVDWLLRHCASLGGDPGRIFLMGHSAGGAHVASYLFDPALAASARRQMAGAILVSARLQADALPDNPNAQGVRAYFGADAALYAARSPLTYAEAADLPLMVAIAQFENPYLDVYGAEFFLRVLAARRCQPRFIQMMKHNHTSIVAHFNSGEELLGREILRFMQAQRM